MNKAEKMPERKDYEIYAGIWDSPQYMKDLESFCTQQAEEIKKKDRMLENVYSVLEAYGVPRKRAGRPANGIMVLMSRMQKEINGYQYNIQTLEEEKREAVELAGLVRDGYLHDQRRYTRAHELANKLLIDAVDPFLSTQAEKGD